MNDCTSHISRLALSALSTTHLLIIHLGTTVYKVPTVYTTIHIIQNVPYNYVLLYYIIMHYDVTCTYVDHL